eukprot:gene6420-7079_t
MFRSQSVTRRLFSSLKDSRLDRKAKLGNKSTLTNKIKAYAPSIAVVTFFGTAGFLTYKINSNPDGFIGKLYYESAIHRVIRESWNTTSQIFEPANDKLLPDWGNPAVYGNIPPGTPAPPLLVIDLERTLIGSVHDMHHGWRHVKRPGLDTFINALSSYYEIVIVSENDIGVMQEIMMAVDKEGRCHKLGSSACEMRGTQVLKRLDLMNRDISRIILIDDDPVSSQLFPRNTLHVKPFVDINDKSDRVLYDLIPLLQAFVHEDVRDFRQSFDNLGTHDAEDAAVEYRMRLAKRKQADEEKRNRGLGGLLRAGSNLPAPEEDFAPSALPSPSQLVGAAPKDVEHTTSQTRNLPSGVVPGIPSRPSGPAEKKKGKLFSWLEEAEKAKEEEEKTRREKMNELYMQRQRAKTEQQQQQ